METSVYNETLTLPAAARGDSQFRQLLALLDGMMETASRRAWIRTCPFSAATRSA